MSDTVAGRVWKFGDNVNTDLMLPGSVSWLSEEEQVKAIFRANRPGWVEQVRLGDVLVAGVNFGLGSGRPAARSLRNAGIRCLLADSINGLFFRNCVTYGLLALRCPGVSAAFDEGQTAEVSVDGFTVRNRETGAVLHAQPIPENLLVMMQGGGLFPVLEKQGLIPPQAAQRG